MNGRVGSSVGGSKKKKKESAGGWWNDEDIDPTTHDTLFP